MIHRHGPASVLAFALALALVSLAGAVGAADLPEEILPLAVVGPDTLDTNDLRLQLNVMLRSTKGQDDVTMPNEG